MFEYLPLPYEYLLLPFAGCACIGSAPLGACFIAHGGPLWPCQSILAPRSRPAGGAFRDFRQDIFYAVVGRPFGWVDLIHAIFSLPLSCSFVPCTPLTLDRALPGLFSVLQFLRAVRDFPPWLCGFVLPTLSFGVEFIQNSQE